MLANIVKENKESDDGIRKKRKVVRARVIPNWKPRWRYTLKYDDLKMFAWANIINNFLKRPVCILLHVSVLRIRFSIASQLLNVKTLRFYLHFHPVVLFLFFIFCFYFVVAAFFHLILNKILPFFCSHKLFAVLCLYNSAGRFYIHFNYRFLFCIC